ncbi:MAG: magnesium chelatase, partial [Lachnospiraceae bacterium]|nr:magnesium chelatase [Lachnospiraceae bacterium]
PRSAIHLMRAAKASALINGREFVLPDDIKELIVPVLLHRILFVNRRDRSSKEDYLNSVIKQVEVPTENFRGI